MRENTCLISFDRLAGMRKAAGLSQYQKTGQVERLYPEKFNCLDSLLDPDDPEFKFRKRLDQLQKSQFLLFQDGTRAEFERVSLLSPQKLALMKKLADGARQKRETVKRYNKRVKDSELKRVATGQPLGNIGNNVDNIEKPVREKRYKIQRFIQKNGLSRSQYVCNCGVNIGEWVDLKKNPEHGNINFSGVATCGSVWACPVCRQKIINKRSGDLETIYKNGRERGYKFDMVTFTFRHKKAENLAALYGSSTLKTGLAGAWRKFRESREFKDLKKDIQYIGDVRGVEITYGKQNGFHPHIHFLVISEKGIRAGPWEKKLFEAWARFCKNSGIGIPSQERGVKITTVQDANQAAYLADWSVGSELASQDKEARGQNVSIAELEFCLVDRVYGHLKGYSVGYSAAVLRSYYAAMEGQKMLTWGGLASGWKDDLLDDEDDLTDEEITQEEYQNRETLNICVIAADIYGKARKAGLLNDIIERVEKLPVKDGNLYSVNVTSVVKQLLKNNGLDPGGVVFGRTRFDKKPWPQ